MKDDLKNKHEGGGTGKRRADIRDVAKTAGVAIATVSRFHSGKGYVGAETRRKIGLAIAELDYKPNDSGRALRTQQTGAVALLISNIQNTFYATIAAELERALSEIGQAAILGNTQEDQGAQDRYLDEMIARNVRGVVLLCAVASDRLASQIDKRRSIFINREIEGFEDHSFVGIDDFQAARELAQLMVRNGARHVAVIHGPTYSKTSRERWRGMIEGLKSHGIDVAPDAQIEAQLSIESGYKAAAALFSRSEPPNALFCGNDQIAYGAFRRCRELSIDVPSRMAIYGFDDNPLNQWLAPWLSTVRVPCRAYAQESVELLRHLWAGGQPKRVIVPYEIVNRS